MTVKNSTNIASAVGVATAAATIKGMAPDTLESRYRHVQDRIAEAARVSGRKPSDIILVAVTKFADPEQIKTLLALGHRDFGENRAQVLLQHASIVEEFLTRQRMLPGIRKIGQQTNDTLFASPAIKLGPVPGQPGASDGVRWHMIGHLQRNKARKVIEFVRLVHSVDSLRLAEELQQIAIKRDQIIEVLLQVNCSGETSKFGCPMPAAIPMAEQLQSMLNIRIRGLMTMAAEGTSPEEARPAFIRCRELFEEMSQQGFGDGSFNILSMGMSGDYEVAISEGANIVRVGSAIFGQKAAGEEHAEPPEPDEAGESES